MKQDPAEEQRLTELVDRTLRGLPLRRAPATLELRVLAELQQREPRFWWQRSFRTWPVSARAAFVAVSVALIFLSLLGGRWGGSAIESLRRTGVAMSLPAHRAVGFLNTIDDLGRLLMRVIPADWLYSVGIMGAALYLCLFSLGTVAYRTLYLKPGKGG